MLHHLNGYQGARPVRIGNAAYQQAQHDVWGVVLDSIYLHTKSRDRLDDRVWKLARQQVERALERWREPDRGIWEVRGEPKHFTSSKIFCWVACDRGARLATIFPTRDFVQAGGLLSYGPNFPDLFRRSAEIVDKILHGTKPADIPVEQPTKFDLAINLATAKVLGLEVPHNLLVLADEVIE